MAVIDIFDSEISDLLFKIQLTIGDREFNGDVRPDLKIDYDNLEEDLAKIPASYAFWGMVYSEAKRAASILEKRIRIRRGKVADQLLKMAKAEKIKLHRGDVEDLIETDEELLKLEILGFDMNRVAGKLWNITKALEIKADSLRSLAGFKRQEQAYTKQ